MGFRFRRSMRVMPGVRLTLSKSGVGVSAGVRGAHVSLGGDKRIRSTVGLPGTGLFYQETETVGSQPRRSSSRTTATPTSTRTTNAAPPPPSTPAPAPSGPPGLFADRDEKALYRAMEAKDWDAATEVATSDRDYALAAWTVAGLGWLTDGQPDHARPLLEHVVADGRDPAEDPFVRRYLAPAGPRPITISPGLTAELPVSRDLVGLALAELLQADGAVDEAIKVVAGLAPTTLTAASLAELFLVADRWDDVVSLTDGVEGTDDLTCWLLVCRGTALRHLHQPGAAVQVLTNAVRRRSLDADVKRTALVERAAAWLDQNQKAKARHDLDRVTAEDASAPGLADVRARLDATSH